ncbi:Evolved beta-galactosidase subunit alpha [Lachnellula arida]|uniref:Evolved beta-galactosidase subunit alpha n=1 Tax=Lachnellula arida TaxID=1316785 RepID=A0A8T9BD34_9HELO|nr:Evolved beta-galactosidase subunit alpha [Lachnellula arida]
MRVASSLILFLQATLALASSHGNNPLSPGKARRQSVNATAYAVQEPPLTTDWTYKLGTNPWPEYPRPQLERSEWQNLNGLWTYQNASSLDAVNSPPFNQTLANEVLIPSCLESAISGIQSNYSIYSWFQTSFTIPSSWSNQSILLNFGAVDYEATVFINGRKAGFNRGGYLAFTIDATSFVSAGGQNEIPCSGIWQSVWIESAPANYITQLDVSADMNGVGPVEVIFYDSGSKRSPNILASQKGTSDASFQFTVPSPKLWSPDSPNLYNFTVIMGSDQVSSYTGFRTISKGKVDGIVRPLLNGEFIFQFGTLDQGYWPDGVYTPPNREAMVYDLQVLKKLGFNMVRKHIKVENALFYQACDQMGLLLIQDMPALRPLQSYTLSNCTSVTYLPDADQQAEFTRQLEVLVNQHKSYPSIGTWIIYNEGWGQVIQGYPEFGLTDLVRSLDPTRLIDSTTGWYDHGAGDYSDNHHYANPQCGSPFYSTDSSPYDPTRIGFQGEFGGIGQNVSIDHLWNIQEAIDGINQTYEIDTTIEAWNYRAHRILDDLTDQTKLYACSGGVWTQTTDVEGEVNGLLTYDRRVLRPDVAQWQADIKALYDAAAGSHNASMALS